MSTIEQSYLVGLIGEGVEPSLSPALHEAAADAHGLRYVYRPVDLLTLGRDATAVGDLLRAGRDLGFNAFNITHPCKQVVIDQLDSLSDHARRLGAVNTVLIRDGRFHGENTDFSGFGFALRTGLPDATLDSVVQLGAGGAGSAVAYALLDAGACHLALVDTDATRCADRATALAGHFPHASVTAHGPDEVPGLLAAADGLLNATPIGMHQHPGLPLDTAALQARHWVADVIYRPVDTELIRTAAALGCRTLDGGHMAVGQAVGAFAHITGIEPDATAMRAHFLDLIGQGL
ncbi:shikimate dehydrogenase [Arthrobacter sp. JSM 101049]|uniref:shikimate dehydrogenase n=1 Tax=Arthrobacter sp. JSM 101049 TaxID=929097 RepID=UPI0035627833